MRRAILAAVALGAVLTAAGARAQPATPRMLVMPFENVTRESRIFWLSEASAVLLADNLNALGVAAITREERRQAFARLQVPPVAALTDATVIRIGQLVGAAQVVVGTLELEGETLVVHARTIALDQGRIRATITERGPVPDLYATFERVARALAPPSPRSPEDVTRGQPPVPAFENYIKGLVADTPATAIGYLNMALQAYPSYVRPRLALWEIFSEQDDHELALGALQPVPAGAPSARRARFLTGLSQLRLGKSEEAVATYQALVDEQPTANALNNLAVAHLRRGGAANAERGAHFFNRALEADEGEPDYFFNLGYAYWLAGKSDAAGFWLRETVRRNPADGDAHFVLAAALSAAGSTAEAGRELELARRLSSTYEGLEQRSGASRVPPGLERLKNDVELPNARLVETTLTTAGQREQQELARFHLERAGRLFEEELDREALAELARAVFLSPYDSAAHLLVGRIHLRNGRTGEAIDALKISLWSEETAAAHGLLAQAYLEARDPAAAGSEAQRALELDPSSPAALEVLEEIGRSPTTSPR